MQNPDTFLWDFQERYDNFELIPFAPPPFLFGFPYKMNTYLQPPLTPLIPQVQPKEWKIPPLDFTPDEIYELDLVVSYQFLIKNEIPQGEKYNISKPVSPIGANKIMDYSCDIDVSLDDDIEIPNVLDILLPYILRQHKDEVLECLYKGGVQLREDSYSNKNNLKNKTLFTLPPKWVRVSLQNGFLILKVFKEK